VDIFFLRRSEAFDNEYYLTHFIDEKLSSHLEKNKLLKNYPYMSIV